MNLLSTSRLGAVEAVLLFSSLALAQSPQSASRDTNPRALSVDGSLQSAPPVPESTDPSHLLVTFRNGLLRIDADNSMLHDTLKAVVAEMGAVLEFPADELGERIFAHIGPAPAHEVIAQLLNGSRFNFVIVSSPSDPTSMEQLIITGVAQTHESAAPVPIPTQTDGAATDGAATAQLYGGGFNTDPGAPSMAEPIPPEESIGIGATSEGQSPSWVHQDGAKLTGEDLDKMQKLQIKQEQQLQQLQQQNAPPQ
jgi:hypothetical protein